ncbi:hypothetical protein ACFPES_23375 [Paenibacillus sp. GCM10023248]|uniref:hypothetical protein n=1 Tax=unclassified Paenibacillus TaxID=185978 RepID=UPI0023799611|nr:hypothetical protein [Paenibacillus sp. MAHUQ-63]MDD9270002.1 hypothetical protein [Paenibacillus sp. MAHUQ-63]
MTSYWLTPVVSGSPLVLGAERIRCTPQEALDSLRELAGRKHPRLLPLFKASLLLSDDEELCGSEVMDLDLSISEAIVFDGAPFHLSHCGEAFLNHLLSREQALQLVSEWELNTEEEGSVHYRSWIREWRRWLATGYDVILLREDG